MEIRCPGCATLYAIADDQIRGRRGRFACHRCKAKVPIDGTALGAAAARPGAMPEPPAAPAAPALAGVDTDDDATSFFSAAAPPLSFGTAGLPAAPPVGEAAPDSGLSDAIDEDEATRMVSIIGPGRLSLPGVAPGAAAPKVSSKPPLPPKSRLPSVPRLPPVPHPSPAVKPLVSAQSDEDEATKMVTALGASELAIGASPEKKAAPAPAIGSSASDPEEDEATKMVTALGASELRPLAPAMTEPRIQEAAPPAPAAPAAPAAAPPVAPRSPRRAPEVTGRTRIIQRPAEAPAPRTGGALQVALLMLAAGVGGFVLSQVVNARRRHPPPSVAPGSTVADQIMARAAVARAAGEAATCAAPGQPAGEANVTVRFLPTGRVAEVRVGAPLGGTPTGACISGRFEALTVGPFPGEPITLAVKVRVP